MVLERLAGRERPGRRLTTVGNWRGYGSVEQDGVHYGQKAHSHAPLHGPAGAGAAPAFGSRSAIHPERDAATSRRLPATAGRSLDPLQVAGTPDQYREFIRGSRGELGVAKSGYVLSRCGWFSDRSACYLASGRPVVAQETGWSAFLPAGEGCSRSATRPARRQAIERVESGYERHAQAARAVAEEHLDSDRVLGRLLDRLLG